MDQIGETCESSADVPPECPAIVWERQGEAAVCAFQPVDQHAVPPAVRRFLEHWSAALSRPTFGQIHGRSPMETTLIVWASESEAADVLDHAEAVEWGRGRRSGELCLGPFRAAPGELGRPWVADAILRGYRVRRLRVSVAIFRYGKGRCGIQIRPGYRRPWSSRRLRRCLQSTHRAVDRLGELVLAVDFTPPRHVVADSVSV